MKITLIINYQTNWGDAVYVTGNTADLGEGNIEKARRMEPTYGNNWYAILDVENVDEIEYNYLIKRDDGIVQRKEWGKPHKVNVDINSDTVDVYDSWQDMPDDCVFYSTAFSEGIFKHKQEKDRVGAKSGQIVLSVFAPMLKPNEVVAVVGESEELGYWQVRNAKVLNGKDSPKWTIALTGENTFFEYKFVILDAETKSLIAWEDGGNRIFDINVEDGGVVVINDLVLRNPLEKWRGAGTAIPVFSLRSEDDYGVGDFYDLFKMIDWAEATNQKMIQLLPINDTTMTRKWTDSYPYNANSIFALHPMYLRPDAIGELEDKKLLKSFKSKAEQLNKLAAVDYEEANNLKESYTKALYAQLGEKTSKSIPFRIFFKKNAEWLKPYAAYSVLRDDFGTPDFNKWGEYAKYDEAKIDAFIAEHKKEIGYIYFVQYHLDKQLFEVRNYARKHNVVLKGDIPIGVSPVSVDAWIHPELFHLDSQAGAPPDDFSILGQNWGLPTYNWEVMAQDGYAWWKNRFRKMADYFDAYRIDHILGFFRIWQIPTDFTHGLLGTFYPALPFTADELRYNYDFWMDRDLYTTPYIHESFLNEFFGEYTQEVKERFLFSKGDYLYGLQGFVSTQRNVIEYFSQFPEDEKSSKIKDGLMRIIDEVLFIIDKEDSEKYHPRISAQSTMIYKSLNEYEKSCFNRLYEDFFYHRHNEFWKRNALQKLPVLTQATDMLVCGEDLGMIPACVADVMQSQKYLSLEIPRMPKGVGEEFGNTYAYPYLSVCTTSTHDMAGIRAWWEENPDATQRYYNYMLGWWGKAPEKASPEICEAIVNTCLNSPSILCVLPLQDWMAMDGKLRRDNPQEEQINVPAISRHYWRYRMHVTLEELCKNDEFTQLVRGSIEKSGR